MKDRDGHLKVPESQGPGMNETHILQLCATIRETAFAIHRYHRHGHLEKIYENALAHRLRKLGLDVRQQHPLQVFDEDGTLLGEFFADLLVANELIRRVERPVGSW